MARHLSHMFEKRQPWRFEVRLGTLSVEGSELSERTLTLDFQRGKHVASSSPMTAPRSGPSAGSIKFNETL